MKQEVLRDCLFIVLGASGDLAKRKLIPALYELIRSQRLAGCAVVGAGLEDVSTDIVLENSRMFIERGDNSSWRAFRENFMYVTLDVSKREDMVKLVKVVHDYEKKAKKTFRRLLYVATPPDLFCTITENAAQAGLIVRQEGEIDLWQRIVYEKPFGSDLQSCKEINACIKRNFSEDQIWRMDHYLSKELVTNISMLRFSNTMFEPLWFAKYVDHMQIVLDEKAITGTRGHYYDAYGAVKDVVQNHLIQLLALVTMEDPVRLSGEYLRDVKAEVIEKMVVEDGVFGQYLGYRDEPYVRPESKTETFVALKMRIDTPRWQHVPFFIRTGKGMGESSVAIHIFFRPVICKLEELSDCRSNILTIRISPDAGFLLQLNVQKPGAEEVVPISLSFCYDCNFEMESMTAYEKLMVDIIRGYKSVGVRNDEIEASWKVIDAMMKLNLPMYIYKIGSEGPKEIHDFIKKYGRKWFYGHKSSKLP